MIRKEMTKGACYAKVTWMSNWKGYIVKQFSHTQRGWHTSKIGCQTYIVCVCVCVCSRAVQKLKMDNGSYK